jgi:release factor glutamine methyltransferase
MAAAREALAPTRPGRRRVVPAPEPSAPEPAPESPSAWTDPRGRDLYPLALPELVADPGVALPGDGSLMTWQYLRGEGIGAHQRCLDVGSGTGILAIQLALNGAAHVHAIDIDERAVRNTEANAFRNAVGDRVSAARVDLHPWVPEERYEVIVASLDQTPIDPYRELTSHRPVDYWGRMPFDHLLAKLPDALAPEGVAYVMQLSLLSRRRTGELLAAHGLDMQIVAHRAFPLPAELEDHRAQIERVEELSDAHRLHIGDRELLVAYLLEIRQRE